MSNMVLPIIDGNNLKKIIVRQGKIVTDKSPDEYEYGRIGKISDKTGKIIPKSKYFELNFQNIFDFLCDCCKDYYDPKEVIIDTYDYFNKKSCIVRYNIPTLLHRYNCSILKMYARFISTAFSTNETELFNLNYLEYNEMNIEKYISFYKTLIDLFGEDGIQNVEKLMLDPKDISYVKGELFLKEELLQIHYIIKFLSDISIVSSEILQSQNCSEKFSQSAVSNMKILNSLEPAFNIVYPSQKGKFLVRK